MSIFKILFSFSGRIPRLTYWVANFGIQATLFLVDFIAGPIRGTIGPGHASYASLAATVATATLVASTYLCAFWCTLAVAVKRWHDRGKSGLWMFIGLIPFIGPFWYFLELAFLEGTPGPNEFDEGNFSGDVSLADDDPLLSMPQIAGRQCAHCQQKILSFIGAELCSACTEPLHSACCREHLAGAHPKPERAAYPC